MSGERDSWEGRCRRCGHRTDGDAINSTLDPLQVFECGRCGSILDIGAHRW